MVAGTGDPKKKDARARSRYKTRPTGQKPEIAIADLKKCRRTRQRISDAPWTPQQLEEFVVDLDLCVASARILLISVYYVNIAPTIKAGQPYKTRQDKVASWSAGSVILISRF